MFGDWYLAMAGYNAGEGKIQRALARTGHKDFWSIARTSHIRLETKNYVPAILAAESRSSGNRRAVLRTVRRHSDLAADPVAHAHRPARRDPRRDLPPVRCLDHADPHGEQPRAGTDAAGRRLAPDPDLRRPAEPWARRPDARVLLARRQQQRPHRSQGEARRYAVVDREPLSHLGRRAPTAERTRAAGHDPCGRAPRRLERPPRIDERVVQREEREELVGWGWRAGCEAVPLLGSPGRHAVPDREEPLDDRREDLRSERHVRRRSPDPRPHPQDRPLIPVVRSTSLSAKGASLACSRVHRRGSMRPAVCPVREVPVGERNGLPNHLRKRRLDL